MNMPEPVDAIRAFHHAFRNDMERIDTAAFETAKGKEGLAGTIERYRFFNEMLVWHAKGEEIAIFPAIESVAPLVAEAYILDHHGLDAARPESEESQRGEDLERGPEPAPLHPADDRRGGPRGPRELAIYEL